MRKRNLNPEVIGVDFDNTIVSYDGLMYAAAVERGLISAATAVNKKAIRDAIRSRPGGDEDWTRLQSAAYGPLMAQAHLINGVIPFFRRCRAEGLRTVIVSHKTEFAPFDPTGTNLRTAALAWLEREGFFSDVDTGLRREDVYFGATREEKIGHIVRLGCSVFIDDLEEVFLSEGFPRRIVKILFSVSGDAHPGLNDVIVCRKWEEIYAACFG